MALQFSIEAAKRVEGSKAKALRRGGKIPCARPRQWACGTRRQAGSLADGGELPEAREDASRARFGGACTGP